MYHKGLVPQGIYGTMGFSLEKIQHLLKKSKKRLASTRKKDIIVTLLFERATKQASKGLKNF